MSSFFGAGLRFPSKPKLVAVFCTISLLLGIGHWWRVKPSPLLWSDIREGDGAVLSLAAGKDPSGSEIVVAGGYFRTDDSGRDLRVLCYDASNGRVRWEVRENKALPNMMTAPVIAIDHAGDVLVGWETAAARLGGNNAISKFGGTDGHPLWEWSLNNTDSGTSMTAIPVPSSTGALWVSGIHKVSGGHRRFIAALNTKTGAPLWENDMNSALDGFDRPARIHHLKDGGAVVLVPPLGGEGMFPWILQCIEGVDGTLRWKQEITRENDRSLQELGCLVDEENGQVIVSWNSVTAGRMHFDVVSLDLGTKAERWRSRDMISGADFASGVETITLGKNGGVELWGRRVDQVIHTKWWSWRMDHGIPSPDQESEQIERPIRVTLSPIDGSVTNRDLLGKPKERVMARLYKPSSMSPDLLILCLLDHQQDRIQNEPWRGQWRASLLSNKSWLALPRREPTGETTSLDFPESSALTTSGILVLGSCRQDDGKRQWQIRVW